MVIYVVSSIYVLVFSKIHTNCKPVVPGVAGGTMATQILADQLTLSQPGGTDYAHCSALVPPDFQTFRRPCTYLPCTYGLLSLTYLVLTNVLTFLSVYKGFVKIFSIITLKDNVAIHIPHLSISR